MADVKHSIDLTGILDDIYGGPAGPIPVTPLARSYRGPRKRHWMFTSFLGKIPETFDEKKVRYVIYQQELSPETKRKHFQGYVEFYDNVRRGQIKAIFGECHCEPRRGSRTEAREYCRKEETRVAGTGIEWGIWRADVTRKRKLADMLLTNMTLDELIENSPIEYVRHFRGLEKLFNWRRAKKIPKVRDVKVLVYIGKTGTGKTWRAIHEHPDHYLMPCCEATWFDNYRGEKTLILDDFYGNIKFSHLLRILDRYKIQVAFKGGFVYVGWSKVVITSNAEVVDWYRNIHDISALLRRIDNNIIHM